MTNLETNFLEVLKREAVRFCSRTVRLFSASLAQMRTALIRDFNQWFCKESARRAVRVYDKIIFTLKIAIMKMYQITKCLIESMANI